MCYIIYLQNVKSFVRELTVSTGIVGASVFFFFTVRSRKAHWAKAAVAGSFFFFQTCAPIKTGSVNTGQDTVLTVDTIISWRTCAFVIFPQFLQKQTKACKTFQIYSIELVLLSSNKCGMNLYWFLQVQAHSNYMEIN